MRNSINSIFGIVLLNTTSPLDFLFWIGLIITGLAIPIIGTWYRIFLRERVQKLLQKLKEKYKL